MRPEADVYSYVQDLEKHLQMTSFGGMADPEWALLLVRGAIADGDRDLVAALARQTQRLAMITPGDPDNDGRRRPRPRADRAEPRRPAAGRGTLHGRAGPDRRPGERRNASAGPAIRGLGHDPAQPGLCPVRGARRRYQDLARAHGPDLRAAGTRLRHWTHADRPAFGWDSLTDTERRVADLVAQGL